MRVPSTLSGFRWVNHIQFTFTIQIGVMRRVYTVSHAVRE